MFVIVYGTLKKGGKFHRYMEGAEYIEDVEVEGYRMYDTGFGYPAITKSDGHSFYGELYKTSETILKTLDIVEGVRSGLFKRKMVSWVDVLSKSLAEDAVVYVIGDTSSLSAFKTTPIDSGVWVIDKDKEYLNFGNILKDIKSKVTQIYAYTEGVNRDLGKSDLIEQLKHVSLSVEEIATYISDNISKMENSDEK